MKFDRTTGLEILKEIRSRLETVPVILVTGYQGQMREHVDAALKNEAHACLDKPVDMDRLLVLLAELRHARLRRMLEIPARQGR
jgi:DNA-binding NtrC family response regulator